MSKKYFVFIFIFAGSICLMPFLALQAQAATLYFSPASGSFEQGSSFWLAIMVNTGGESVNAIGAYLSYPEDKLEPLGVGTTGSVMTLWAEKNMSAGKIDISGGLPTPGFSGVNKVATIGFKVKASSGSVTLQFNENSAVITDVGEEKDIHPRKKAPVGARLALAARGIAYGEHLVYSGPTFQSIKVNSNTEWRANFVLAKISFANIASVIPNNRKIFL